jgi:hypothetical protein
VHRSARRLPLLALALAALALIAEPARAGEATDGTSAPASPGRAPELVTLRFGWPAALDAQVSYRRTRQRTGTADAVFSARWRQRAERDAAGWRIDTRDTRWEGDPPFPPEVAEEALRASEQVVQRIAPEGEFLGLENAEALRPVLARVFGEAGVAGPQAERAVALAEASARAEARELWNLGVGFWIDAELELGEPYVMQGEAELPLLPGVRADQSVEFRVRRRVPCVAGERAPRCVEVLLRSTPDRAALRRSARALVARLAGPGAEGALEDGTDPAELSAESELVLVTDPATLVPRRVVWTRSVRLGAGDHDVPAVEQVERREYDYRYPERAPAPKRKPGRRAARR